MQNILTIDLEDWYQGQFYKSKINISDWDRLKSKLVIDTLKILHILRQLKTYATFFIVAYNAKRHPEILHLIEKDGHELALHGYYHDLVYRQTPTQFRNEIDYSKKLIEDISQTKVIGFRAPTWSIKHSCLWALDILLESGFLYDSSMERSVFKNIHDKIPPGLLEIPRSTFEFLGRPIPFAGGFFLRAYPYYFTKWLIQQKNKKGDRVLIYIHPWEFNTDPAEIELVFPKKFINEFRLHTVEQKFELLQKDFNFNSIKNIFFIDKK